MPTSAPDVVAADPRPADPILEVRDLVAGYDGVTILHGLSLRVGAGEIVCVVGPNGSGKSTLFKAVFGLIGVQSGEVLFEGTPVGGVGPQALLRRGVALVPQLSSVFPQMTVQENLELGTFIARDRSLTAMRIDEVFGLFPRLAERRRQLAGTLSGGERRAVEIGRALMLRPRLLLMDEPSVGLSPVLVREVFEQLRRLRREAGLSFLLIEQNARSGLELSDRGYVIDQGRVAYEGDGDSLLGDPEVRRAFLGG